MPHATCIHPLGGRGHRLGRALKCLTKVRFGFLAHDFDELVAEADITDSCMFYKNLAVYKGFGGIVLAEEEGERLADALGEDCLNLILQNHG